MTVEEVIDRVLKYPTSLVEITGGEPLLQEPVYRLSEQLLENGKEVMIETGGSLDITRVDPRVVLVHDLKCPDSGMLEHNRWENLKHLRRHDEIKFVISSRTDYEWARQVVIKQALPSRHVVLFSPAWQLLEPTLLARWILSDGLPVRLQVQLHKILWGEQRGV